MSATEHLIGKVRLSGITRGGTLYETSDAYLADAVWAVINGEAMIVSKSGILFEERNVGDEQVTPGGACVFCDIGLKPHADGVHRANGHEVQCANGQSAD